MAKRISGVWVGMVAPARFRFATICAAPINDPLCACIRFANIPHPLRPHARNLKRDARCPARHVDRGTPFPSFMRSPIRISRPINNVVIHFVAYIHGGCRLPCLPHPEAISGPPKRAFQRIATVPASASPLIIGQRPRGSGAVRANFAAFSKPHFIRLWLHNPPRLRLLPGESGPHHPAVHEYGIFFHDISPIPIDFCKRPVIILTMKGGVRYGKEMRNHIKPRCVKGVADFAQPDRWQNGKERGRVCIDANPQ